MTLQPPKQELGRKIKSYHLFGDCWDEWFTTRKEAEKAYKECDDANLRLYKDVSYENGYEVEEEYIKGRGDFPW